MSTKVNDALVGVHETPSRRTLDNSMPGRVVRRKPLVSRMNIAACLQFAGGKVTARIIV